jgi:exopolyphosphatase/guanosine-5'-triphosphate,3'-diphosphate pyrophosphatase
LTLWSSADLGTNTFRLLVAEEVAPGRLAFRELHQQVVRLGQGLTPGGTLGREPLARAEQLLRRFRERLDALGVEHRVGAITAAGRAAVDGQAFAARASELLAAAIRVVPGEEEARLSALGGLSLVDGGGRGVLFLDIGGGSTEVVAATVRGDEEIALSLPTGVVGIWEAVRPSDPPAAEDLAALEAAAREGLAPLDRSLDAAAWRARLDQGTGMVLATAGTALTVAARVHGRSIEDTRALCGLVVSRAEVEGVWREFSALTAAQRRALPSMEAGREDVILAGLALLRAFLDRFGATELTATDGGLLEGVLLQAVREARGGAAWGDIQHS